MVAQVQVAKICLLALPVMMMHFIAQSDKLVETWQYWSQAAPFEQCLESVTPADADCALLGAKNAHKENTLFF